MTALKKIWNTISTILVVLMVLCAVFLMVSRVLGYRCYAVISGSMEPVYPVGSLIYVKAVDYKELKVGDPITFMVDQDTIVTHRIIDVLIDEENPEIIRYFTKGDANDIPDGASVHYKNIMGTPVFTIPYMGYVSNYIQNPPGMYIAISAGAILLMLVFLPDLFEDNGKKKKEEKAEAAPEQNA